MVTYIRLLLLSAELAAAMWMPTFGGKGNGSGRWAAEPKQEV